MPTESTTSSTVGVEAYASCLNSDEYLVMTGLAGASDDINPFALFGAEVVQFYTGYSTKSPVVLRLFLLMYYFF